MFSFLRRKENARDEVSDIIEWQKKMMKKYGYYVHGVILNDDNESYMDYHTHGLKASFGLPELQIVFPVSRKLADNIFKSVIKAIRKGEGIYLPNSGSSDPFLLNLIDGDRILVKFHWVKNTPEHNSDDSVLRIILSDTNFRFNGDPDCDLSYSGQEDFEIKKSGD